MLSASGVGKSYGGQRVLEDVTLSVGPGSRLGVVGRNGVGKTTLLRILAGDETPDRGRVRRVPAALQVGYLPQEPGGKTGETLRVYLARRTAVAAAEANLERRNTLMAAHATDTAVEEYSEALDRFLALGGDDFAARVGEVCADVGLPADRLDVAMTDLSGGQAARAALAAILLARFDVFLLDEPTNDLDFAGLDRLEAFMSAIPGGAVVVSHDRAFLDDSVTTIVELHEETHRATEYAGGWTDYVAARQLARAQQYEAHGKYVAERARLEERLRSQRAWAAKGAGRERKTPRDNDKAQRDWRVNRTEKQAAKVRVTEKRLAALASAEKPWEGWHLQLQLAPTARSGDIVVRLEKAVIERGTFRLGPLDVEVSWQERVAILGPNGSGKTTLLKAVLGEVALASGRRWLGPGVRVGEMEQGRGIFSGDEIVLDGFMRRAGFTRLDEARSLLAKFGLGAGHVGRRGGQLSPGERSRAILASLMAQGVNCLVLDEPTNHLDIEAIEQLEQALEAYTGTLLLVTHDRRFLDAVRITRTIDLGQLVAPSTSVRRR